MIDQILGEFLGGNRDKVYRLKLGYAQKLALLESFDLVPPELIASPSELNRLRNKSVHTLNAKLTPGEIRPIFDGLPEPSPPNARESNDTKLMLHRYMAFMGGYLPTPLADAAQEDYQVNSKPSPSIQRDSIAAINSATLLTWPYKYR